MTLFPKGLFSSPLGLCIPQLRRNRPRTPFARSPIRSAHLGLALLAVLLLLAVVGCTGRSLITWGESGGDGWTVTAVDDSRLYVVSRQGTVIALESVSRDANPRILWTHELARYHGAFGTPAVGREHIYIGDKGDLEGENGQLLALLKDREPPTGITEGADLLQDGEWSAAIEGGIVGAPVLAEDESLVLVASDNGDVYAFNTTGSSRDRQVWSFTAGGQVWSTPAVSDGIVYVGSLDQYLYAVSLDREIPAGESRLLWKYKTDGAVMGSPIVLDGPSGKMVVAGSVDRKMYALGASDGELIWSFTGDDWIWADPVADEEHIYVASMSGTVYALDRSGNLVWETKLEDGSPVVSRPVVQGEDIVVATDEGKLFRLDTGNGQRVGGFHDLSGRVKASPSILGGNVFVGVEDNSVRGIDLEDWREAWNFSTKDR